MILRKRIPRIRPELLLYVLALGIILPLLSVLVYFIRGGLFNELFYGFNFLKSYLFLGLALLLSAEKIDLQKPLSVVLSLLSIAIIVIGKIASSSSAAYFFLWEFGHKYQVLYLGQRQYGNFRYMYTYFISSPILVMALAYFSYQVLHTKARARFWNICLLVLNMVGMFRAGTRNDMIASAAVPMVVFFWYSTKKIKFAAVAFIAIGIMIGLYPKVIVDLFSTKDISNSVRVHLVSDYKTILSNPTDFLAGQGVGSYFISSTRTDYISISEVSYLELLREYGLLLYIPFLLLLMLPLVRLLNSQYRSYHYLFLAFGFYLLMGVSDPMLVSSDGMCILSIIACCAFGKNIKRFSQGDTSETVLASSGS